MGIINYAHRGASEYAPENTFAAFYLGLEMSANGIETDIQRTSDGVLVLFHDDTLERIVQRPGSISDYTYAQLLDMDFGAFKAERYRGERIVTLDAFWLHFARKPVHFALEIKQPEIGEQVLEAIAGYDPARVYITSFILPVLRRIRAIDTEIPLGFLTDAILPETLDRLEALSIGQICPRADLIDAAGMALARARGFSVRAWGVRDATLMHHALAMGVDGMTVNFPDTLAGALAAP